jgi:hypothetical protein
MTLTIIDGRVEDTFKPASRYAEIAVACRAMGIDIANDDYEKIDAMLESNSVWATLEKDTAPDDFLVAGYLPNGATYHREALVN